MSEKSFREQAAALAKAARRMLELERARGGGDVVAAGIAKARARGAGRRTAIVEEPPAARLHEPGPAPIVGAPPAAASFELSKPEPAPAAASFALSEPDPVPAARRAPAPAVAAPIELPPFTDDLNPSVLGAGRAEVLAASLPLLEQVASEARACEKCALCRTRIQAVPGVGSAFSGIVFVGEAPGADEDERGEPFVGRAGELLTKMIAGMDERQLIPGVKLDRSTVYICNVLKCRPPENRNPLPNEIAQCSPYVIRQLEALQPRIICCLGKFAAELLCGIKGTVGSMRGRTYRWRGAKLIVTYHPAYLLRNPSPDGPKRDVWNDLQRLAQEYLTD
jgi:DNA polymerase